MAAFFRNTTQNPLDGNISDTPPVMVVPRPEDRARWEQMRGRESRRRRSGWPKMRRDSAAEFAKWLERKRAPKISGPVDPADEVLASTSSTRRSPRFKNKPLEIEDAGRRTHRRRPRRRTAKR